jgi:ubiquinone/menaquinone biosynthesis methyltransferase
MSDALGVKPVAEVGLDAPRVAAHAPAVRRMFDRISPSYDLLNRLLSWGVDQRWRARALDLLTESLPEGPVLDSCAGTLDLTAALARRAPARSLVAADFAGAMLRRGRTKTPGAMLTLADATRMPFASGSFAGVVCGFGMRNLADVRAGIAEAHRVLRPGGAFVILEFFRPGNTLTRVFHAVYARAVLPWVGHAVSGDGEAYRYLSRSMRAFLSRAEMEDALREAGFRDVRGEDVTFGVASIVRGVK